MADYTAPAPAPAPVPALRDMASLLSGAGFWNTRSLPGADIPEIVLSDGPHGVRRQLHGTDHLGLHHSEPATCFPPAVALGNSWSTSAAALVGDALARESRALGVHLLLGPGVNIKRSPLGGRNFEYFSEDPHLTAELAVAYVRALQAGGVGASLKHFAANDQETARMSVSADVDERPLHEIHLAAFERVVRDAAPATVMASYNKLNGTPTAEHRELLTSVLRDDWGFEGAVVSDWGAVHDPVASLAAGLDLIMPSAGDAPVDALLAAVAEGRLDASLIEIAAARMSALARGLAATEPLDGFDVEEHHALACSIAERCAVLLKNERAVLPIDPTRRVLVVGEQASTPRYQGGGSSRVNATRLDLPVDELARRVEAAGGALSYLTGDDLAAVAGAAAEVDVAIVFAGLPESAESEGFDRTTLELPAEQIARIRAVSAAAPATVVVLAHGGIVTLEGWHDEVDGILDGFLLGQGGGAAIARLLLGEANPSGRLSETIPLRAEDTPTHLLFPGEQGHVRYGEGVMVGYRHYETVGRDVRYPFGYGLSYTTFSTELVEAVIDGEGIGDDEVKVILRVRNTGARAGRHVVQLYVAETPAPVRRPARVLGGFAEVELAIGEQREIEIAIHPHALSYWDIEDHRWVRPAGTVCIQLADDAATVLAEQTITLRGNQRVQRPSLDADAREWLEHPITGGPIRERLVAVAAARGQEFGETAVAAISALPMQQVLGLLAGAMTVEWLDSLFTEGATL